MLKINEVRKIVRDEIVRVVLEDSSSKLDHQGAVAVAASASKLLSALEGFMEKAPQPAIDALMNRKGDLKGALEDMVSSPGSYVIRQNMHNVALADESPTPIETAPKVTIARNRKELPVLDHDAHEVAESINKKLRSRAGK